MKNYKKNIFNIGDLVKLSSDFRKSRYQSGTAPIYQWAVGECGYIVVGKFSNQQTGIITKIAYAGPSKTSFDKRMLKIITDSGEVGWFCEGSNWLIKNC